MVGRFVEQQELRLLQQEPAQRNAPPLTAGELRHFGVIRRTAQRIHRQIDFGVEIPQPLGFDLVLELRHLIGGFVRIVRGNLVIAIDNRFLRRNAFHDVVANRFGRIELRLLRQVADTSALGGPGFAGKLRVEAGHDAKQRRFAGAVDTKHPDLGIGIERQIDVLQDFPVAGIGLGETLHMINELAGHFGPGWGALPLFLRARRADVWKLS